VEVFERQSESSVVSSISIFFPCFNDAATIASMVGTALRTIDRLGVEGDAIVVNDGSTDSSQQVLDNLCAFEPRLRVVRHQTNRGYGGALRSGFAAATHDWVFYTDGDGQFDAAELETLVREASDEVDVVQGYKVSRADSLTRRIVGRAYHRSVSSAFGLKIRDTDCDFRLIRRAALSRISLVHSSGAICVELVRKLQDAGARFVEVPVHHYPRPSGTSQFFTPSRIARSLSDLVALYIDVNRRRPSPTTDPGLSQAPSEWAELDRDTGRTHAGAQ
jgi:glycosyltransferase involved in cell wall biosynthesis